MPGAKDSAAIRHADVGCMHARMQRDVPGFTRGALPMLASEGVQAFTIGVNGGSAPPGVPKNTPFWWRDEASGKQLLGVLHPGRACA